MYCKSPNPLTIAESGILAMNCFLGELEKINWPQMFGHDTTADPLITYYQQFSTKLDEVINTHFPLKVGQFREKRNQRA